MSDTGDFLPLDGAQVLTKTDWYEIKATLEALHPAFGWEIVDVRLPSGDIGYLLQGFGMNMQSPQTESVVEVVNQAIARKGPQATKPNYTAHEDGTVTQEYKFDAADAVFPVLPPVFNGDDFSWNYTTPFGRDAWAPWDLSDAPEDPFGYKAAQENLYAAIIDAASEPTLDIKLPGEVPLTLNADQAIALLKSFKSICIQAGLLGAAVPVLGYVSFRLIKRRLFG